MTFSAIRARVVSLAFKAPKWYAAKRLRYSDKYAREVEKYLRPRLRSLDSVGDIWPSSRLCICFGLYMTRASFSLLAATTPWLRIQPSNPQAYNFRFIRVVHDCAKYALPHALLLSTMTSCFGQHDHMRISWFSTISLSSRVDH